MRSGFQAPVIPAAGAGRAACQGCGERPAGDASRFDMPISMAFQPIVDAHGRVFAQEALVRGAGGESACSVMSRITEQNRYAFDQLCRTTAIRDAAALGIVDSGALLSINFSPNAIYEPMRCISSSLAAARRFGVPNSTLMFEITENERTDDPAHLRSIVSAYASLGFKVALDDFGAGYANLDLLADFLPDIVKLDMTLIRGLDRDRNRQVIVGGIHRMLSDLGVGVIAEGIETEGEYRALRDLGIALFQGYLFARPMLNGFPPVSTPPPARQG